MVMLSLEPRKQIITFYNNYCLSYLFFIQLYAYYLAPEILLNMYVVHDLNGLTFILCVLCMTRIQWWQGTRGQITHVLFLMFYTARNVICACIFVYYSEYLTKFLEQLCKHTHATVKFKLRCTVISLSFSARFSF